MTIHWKVKSFENLTNIELYEMLQLRSAVFVVEQNCPYLDCDDKDFSATHILGYVNDDIVCSVRLIPKGISYHDYYSIGRVVNSANVRNTGVGKQLMIKAHEIVYELWGDVPIKIGAQAYLKTFYEQFGYIDMNEPYLEDGIPHLIMIKPKESK